MENHYENKWLWGIALLPIPMLWLSWMLNGGDCCSYAWKVVLRLLLLACWFAHWSLMKRDLNALEVDGIKMARGLQCLGWMIPPVYLVIRIVCSKKDVFAVVVTFVAIIISHLLLCCVSNDDRAAEKISEMPGDEIELKYKKACLEIEQNGDWRQASELIAEADEMCDAGRGKVARSAREAAYWAMAGFYSRDVDADNFLHWHEKAAKLGGEEAKRRFIDAKQQYKEKKRRIQCLKEEEEAKAKIAWREEWESKLKNCSSDSERMYVRGQTIASLYQEHPEMMPKIVEEFKGEQVLLHGFITTISPDAFTMRCSSALGLTISCRHVTKSGLLEARKDTYVVGKISQWAADLLCLDPCAIVDEGGR